MAEFPYCQKENHIIGNPETKKCYITESGTPCSECMYHQALMGSELPSRYQKILGDIEKFALHRWSVMSRRVL